MKLTKHFTLIGLIIWAVSVSFFLYEYFLRTFIGTLASQVIPDLHLTPVSFALIASAYYLVYAIMQIPAGIIIDKVGVRKVLIFAPLICAISAFMFTHSDGFYMAFISRMIMGFGSAFAFITMLLVVYAWLPKEYFASYSGISQFIGTMGPFLAGGPLILFIKDNNIDWNTALNYIGYIGLGLTISGIIFARNRPNLHVSRFSLKQEKSIKKKITMLVTNNQAWHISLYSACVYSPLSIIGAVWGTEFLETSGLSQASAANAVSWEWLGYAIACPLVGFLSDYTKRRIHFLSISALIGFVASTAMLYFRNKSSLFFDPIFFALGFAAAAQNLSFMTISEHTENEIKSTAIGLNNGLALLFSAFLPSIIGSLITKSEYAHHRDFLASSDFIFSLSIIPIMYAIAFVLAIFFIEETYAEQQR